MRCVCAAVVGSLAGTLARSNRRVETIGGLSQVTWQTLAANRMVRVPLASRS